MAYVKLKKRVFFRHWEGRITRDIQNNLNGMFQYMIKATFSQIFVQFHHDRKKLQHFENVKKRVFFKIGQLQTFIT